MALTDAPEEKPRAPGFRLRAVLPFTTVALILAILYVAWTFYSRSESTKRAQAEIEAKKQASEKRVADQIFGDGQVSFSTFNADSAHLHRGETTQLCYGVVNATTVTIDPPVEQLKPTYRHCLDIAPKKTTTYTITATDSKGNKKSDSVTVHVE
jgi:Tfp pilus assembly protein PilE